MNTLMQARLQISVFAQMYVARSATEMKRSGIEVRCFGKAMRCEMKRSEIEVRCFGKAMRCEMKRSGIEVRCGKQRGALRIAMRSEKEEKMTSKQRAYLKSLAMKMEPIMQIGKATITPELTESVEQALEARELIKINVLKNCVAMPGDVAALLAERTHSDVVQVIGRKIVLYRESKTKKKIELPKAKNTKE